MGKNTIFLSVTVCLLFTFGNLSAQWSPTTGPGGSNVMCLTVVGNDLFAGCSSYTPGGIYCSDNDGNSWSPRGNLLYSDIQAVIYNGTYLFAGGNSGAWLSTNYGYNWYTANNGLSGQGVFNFCILGSALFAGTSSGVFMTTNQGGSWVQSGLSGQQINSLITSGTYIFAATVNGLYRSTNNGVSWNVVSSGWALQYALSLAVSGSTIYASAGFYIYKSTNNGSNWVQIYYNSSGYINALASYNNYVIAGTQEHGAFRSTNGGVNWSQLTFNKYINVIIFKGSILYAGTSIGNSLASGVYCSTDFGNSWIPRGINNQTVKSFTAYGTYVFASTGNGIFITADNGNIWNPVHNGLTNHSVLTMASGGGYVFAGTDNEGVYRTSNNGNNWVSVNTGLISQQVRAVLYNNSYLYAGTTAGVFRSSNNGDLWSSVNSGITNLNVWCLGGTSGILLAGGEGGIYSSTNNGSNWTSIGLTTSGVYKLTVNGNVILASSYYDFYRSTNNGQNWYPCGLTEMLPVSDLISNGNLIFAGCGQNGLGKGVFMSTNYGISWINRNQGFQYLPSVRCLLVANNYIFAGMDTQSVWRRSLTDIIGIKPVSEEIPSAYSLSQNYPNPFNPVTSIDFHIPKSSFVKIYVFDVSGRKIDVLVNQNISAGKYRTEWDASKYSSGIYFYTIISEYFKETKKMILLK